nr:hypothetical protein CFP56_40053 [Quercus suber]
MIPYDSMILNWKMVMFIQCNHEIQQIHKPLHLFKTFQVNTMALFSALIKCFVPSSSSQVSDDAMKADSSEKPKGKDKSKSSGAPIVLSYFPVNSNLSRL